MNPHLLVLTFSMLGCLCCLAQEATPEPASPVTPEPVANAIKKFFATRNGDNPPNEVTVELPPPTDPGPVAPAATPQDGAPPESAPAKDAAPPTQVLPVPSDTSAPPEPKPSLTVQVENLQTGNGTIDPKTVKLLAPFPAKPLAPIPSGWRLDSATSAPPFVRKVDLAPGASITLTIRPHLLVPDATVFAITEPGFNPALGYRQAQTVSAILANSIQQLDEDAKHLGNAIDHLQQLVSSLPRPAATPLPSATPNPPNKR